MTGYSERYLAEAQNAVSAICPHLRRERVLQTRLPTEPGWVPPNPAYTNAWDPSLKEIVMVVFGAQAHDGGLDYDALDPIERFLKADAEHAPVNRDLVSGTDVFGKENRLIIAYWTESGLYQSWRRESGFNAWWESPDREKDTNGWFLESINPSMERLETLTSLTDCVEGVASLAPVSAPIKEHGYWGSMRDRIPLSQTDPMKGNSWRPAQLTDSPDLCGRVVVPPVRNLCVIRSGQDWSQLPPNERKMWDSTMEPTFKRSMDYILHHGNEIGCFDLRLVDHIDADLEKMPKSFGLLYWDDIASAEDWAEHHPTHKAIFDGFFQYVKQLDMNIALRLYHEIYVLDEKQQSFEYIRCHGRTGMLTSLVKQ